MLPINAKAISIIAHNDQFLGFRHPGATTGSNAHAIDIYACLQLPSLARGQIPI